MSFSVKIEDGKLQALIRSIPADVDRIVETSARAIQAGFMHRAPVDTGALRASCTVTNKGKAHKAIGPTVDYATFVELGTRHKAARPALKPAFDAEVPKFKNAFRKLVG